MSDMDTPDWISRLAEARAAERDWRAKGLDAIGIYRAERTADGGAGRGRFNMLYANVSILSPALFQTGPRAEVRGRFAGGDSVADEAAATLQSALNVALDIGGLEGEVRRLVQDMLLPGRGVIRVRWLPVIRADDAGTPEPRKVWESIGFEHVHWEDFTCEPARRWKDVRWCAFRHYLTRAQMQDGFGDDPRIARLLQDTAWGRAAFVHAPTDADGANRHAGASEPRAMVWECWNRETRTVAWVAPDAGPSLLREDVDPLELEGFFPCHEPLSAVATNDTMIPVPEYEIYRDLATEIARLTERIDAIMKRMRVRGLFNGSIEELAEALEGEDGRMIPVSGIDMEGLAQNVWLIPLDMLAQAATSLYAAREQAKQALYEVTGISDVLRGASSGAETATAQRIKGNFGTLRIDERRRALDAAIRETIRIAAEIMASHFSVRTLSIMSGRPIPPQVERFLREEALMMCRIDVETDSTIAADEVSEQEGAARLVQAVGSVLQTIGPIVQAGGAPPELVVETLRLLLRPFRGARELLNVLEKSSGAPPAPQQAAVPPPDPLLDAALRKAELDAAKARLDIAGKEQDLAIRREQHRLAMAQTEQQMAIRRARLAPDRTGGPPPPGQTAEPIPTARPGGPFS